MESRKEMGSSKSVDQKPTLIGTLTNNGIESGITLEQNASAAAPLFIGVTGSIVDKIPFLL